MHLVGFSCQNRLRTVNDPTMEDHPVPKHVTFFSYSREAIRSLRPGCADADRKGAKNALASHDAPTA